MEQRQSHIYTKRDESKLQAVEMKFLMGIVGETRREKELETQMRAQDGGNAEPD
jgi:hypothetical protein